MFRPQQGIKRQRDASMKHVSAPTGGLNARDSIAEMPIQDAVILNNMFCLPDKVMLRRGSAWFATGIVGAIETLAAYNKADGTAQRFAATTANIYDVTVAGAVGVPVVTAQTSGRWQWINIATPGNSFLYMVNGADDPELYDGTTWTAINGASVPAITGVTTNLLINIMAHGQRVYFIEKNTLTFWYLPPDSVGGVAASFDLTTLCVRGGYLVAMFSWTIDAGNGLDDHAVFITSEGEVLGYRGTDPNTPADWVLVGIFYLGRPIGRRCGIQYGADILLITEDGVIPLSAALISGRVNNQPAITNKIQSAISDAIELYGSFFGWQLVLNSAANMLILNVPTSTTTSIQYVMNTISGAWSSWDSLNAHCWVEQDGLIYFGGLTIVYKAWVGTSDPDSLGAASNINAEALQAFSYMGTTLQKSFKQARPIIGIDVPSIGVLIGVNVDYEETPPTGLISFPSSNVGIWDASLWDVAVWGGDIYISKSWQSVQGFGYSGAMHMKITTKTSQFIWMATDYLYQTAVGL